MFVFLQIFFTNKQKAEAEFPPLLFVYCWFLEESGTAH